MLSRYNCCGSTTQLAHRPEGVRGTRQRTPMRMLMTIMMGARAPTNRLPQPATCQGLPQVRPLDLLSASTQQQQQSSGEALPVPWHWTQDAAHLQLRCEERLRCARGVLPLQRCVPCYGDLPKPCQGTLLAATAVGAVAVLDPGSPARGRLMDSQLFRGELGKSRDEAHGGVAQFITPGTACTVLRHSAQH